MVDWYGTTTYYRQHFCLHHSWMEAARLNRLQAIYSAPRGAGVHADRSLLRRLWVRMKEDWDELWEPAEPGEDRFIRLCFRRSLLILWRVLLVDTEGRDDRARHDERVRQIIGWYEDNSPVRVFIREFPAVERIARQYTDPTVIERAHFLQGQEHPLRAGSDREYLESLLVSQDDHWERIWVNAQDTTREDAFRQLLNDLMNVETYDSPDEASIVDPPTAEAMRERVRRFDMEDTAVGDVRARFPRLVGIICRLTGQAVPVIDTAVDAESTLPFDSVMDDV